MKKNGKAGSDKGRKSNYKKYSCFLTVIPFNFSRDSKSAAFAEAQPRAHPSFGVRALPKYAAKRRTETDNRREAAAEGRERGSDKPFI